jgi:hypothetical protein
VDEGVAAGNATAHRDLVARVRRFIKDLKVVIDRDKYDTDITGNWNKKGS